jgi:CDGSH-type Zn-finger protein
VIGNDVQTIRVVPDGPILVRGPVRIQVSDDEVVESDRFVVAICACRRSKTYPLCDTSHRKRKRPSKSKSEGPS